MKKFFLGRENDARKGQLAGGGVVVEIVYGFLALQTETEGAEVVEVDGAAVAEVLRHMFTQGAHHGLDVAGRDGVARTYLTAELLECDRTGTDELGDVADGFGRIGAGFLVKVKFDGHNVDA